MVRVAIALLVTTLLLLVSAGPAAAGPVGKDGKIRACYKVKAKKGKPKGTLRLLLKGKRCKRGERIVAWIAAPTASGTGPGGGQTGQAGTPGAPGSPGGAGSTPDVSALLAQIDALTKRVESLEAILKGITNGDLIGIIGALPTIDALCDQASEMNSAFSALTTGLEGIAVIGSVLPAPPGPFACP